jgi:hypothetical protein
VSVRAHTQAKRAPTHLQDLLEEQLVARDALNRCDEERTELQAATARVRLGLRAHTQVRVSTATPRAARRTDSMNSSTSSRLRSFDKLLIACW